MTEKQQIPFSFAIANGATINQVSSPIPECILIHSAKLLFPLGTGSLLTYRFFELSAPPANNLALPTGPDLTSNLIAQQAYVGDGIRYTAIWNRKPKYASPIIGMWATNLTGAAQVASAAVDVYL